MTSDVITLLQCVAQVTGAGPDMAWEDIAPRCKCCESTSNAAFLVRYHAPRELHSRPQLMPGMTSPHFGQTPVAGRWLRTSVTSARSTSRALQLGQWVLPPVAATLPT